MSEQEHMLIEKLIQSKFQELNNKQDLQTKTILIKMDTGFTLANSKMDSINKRIDGLVEQKKEQNGRIKKLELKTDKTNKRTSGWQFIQTKPWYAVLIGGVFAAGIVYLANNQGILDLVKSFKLF